MGCRCGSFTGLEPTDAALLGSPNDFPGPIETLLAELAAELMNFFAPLIFGRGILDGLLPVGRRLVLPVCIVGVGTTGPREDFAIPSRALPLLCPELRRNKLGCKVSDNPRNMQSLSGIIPSFLACWMMEDRLLC